MKQNPDLQAVFLKNTLEGAEHGQKCIESKSGHSFEKKIKMHNFAFITHENLFIQVKGPWNTMLFCDLCISFDKKCYASSIYIPRGWDKENKDKVHFKDLWIE